MQDVLVVEDDRDAAEITCVIVERLGHACRVAHTGEEAILLARQRVPDVAVIDLGLPDADGFEVARCLRALTPGLALRLVALSGYSDPRSMRKAVENGFDDYMVKPLRIERLVRSISTRT